MWTPDTLARAFCVAFRTDFVVGFFTEAWARSGVTASTSVRRGRRRRVGDGGGAKRTWSRAYGELDIGSFSGVSACDAILQARRHGTYADARTECPEVTR
jgi:hypothetical protein